jgi:hypothetical protein
MDDKRWTGLQFGDRLVVALVLVWLVAIIAGVAFAWPLIAGWFGGT